METLLHNFVKQLLQKQVSCDLDSVQEEWILNEDTINVALELWLQNYADQEGGVAPSLQL